MHSCSSLSATGPSYLDPHALSNAPSTPINYIIGRLHSVLIIFFPMFLPRFYPMLSHNLHVSLS